MKDTPYNRQAELVLDVLPFIARQEVFALKGGTAINFFIRDLPRLSVDIDLSYLPVTEREQALSEVTEKLRAVRIALIASTVAESVAEIPLGNTSVLRGLVVSRHQATVKVEPNLVIRGAVYPPQVLHLCATAAELFERAVEIQGLSHADLYGGKICAALDRQHPRDLFDVGLMLEHDGFPESTRKAFIVYLISHDRPMVELLDPNRQDIEPLHRLEFQGMTRSPVTLEALTAVRERLIQLIQDSLTTDERQFMVSMKQGEPNWDLLGLRGIESLPAVRWKLLNIRKMTPTKRKMALEKLKACLGV